MVGIFVEDYTREGNDFAILCWMILVDYEDMSTRPQLALVT